VKRLLVVGCLLLAGCGTPLHSKALEPSFARTFSGLYALQQHQDGRTGVRPDALRSTARCLRTGPDPDGPGEDWTCTVQYRDNATLFTQAFELQVKSDGCWRAEAPPLAQPAVREDPLTGAVVTNPLAEFDGCLDTSWR
jgi:hypothetical protein